MSATVESTVASTAGGRQFVTFQVQDELFGIPLAEVQEIIRMPALVQVPLSPSALEGISNLRGVVLPITSLRRVFGVGDKTHDDATRVVVVNRGGLPVGFVVDRMSSVVTAEPEEIEEAGAIEATVRSTTLRGVVKRAGGMIMLLDPASVVAFGAGSGDQRSASGNLAAASRVPTDGTTDRAESGAASIDEVQLVSFEVADQEYAFPIADVQEIVQVPPRITQVPQVLPHIVGVMTLRERLLPLVSLRRMFSLPEAPITEHNRIVVVALDDKGGSVGIVMDTVKEVLRVNRALTDPVPALLTDGAGASEFEAICRLDGGKRLVTILSAQRMFRDTGLQTAIAAAADRYADHEDDMPGSDEIRRAGTGADDEEQFVVFRLAGEEYGVPIDAVQEIVRIPDELTRVPKAPAFMEGVVNLRGTVLPVVDQRRRFALDEAVRNDRQRIMVLTIGGIRNGFIVDQVSEVLKIPRSAIGKAPALSEEQTRLIRRVANLEAQKRMILLLDPANLLDAQEIEMLGAL